tara:strand:+ start:1205 stop:2905 length:1701 start_codon:yes stop_codon:yes gene_type:complete
MSGGKGGSTSSSVEIPEYIEKAAQRNLNKAERISQLGYVPYYGPDVAAFTPMQQASFQNTANVANAFGMGAPTSQSDIMGGMGAPTQYAGGVSGYSSAPIYEQSLDQLAMQRPAQKSYMDSFFINPYSGAQGSNSFAPIDYNMYPTYAETQRQAEEAIRREQRSDDNYERLLNQMGQQVSGSSLTQQEMAKYADTIAPGSGYDPNTQVLNEAQRRYVESPEGAAARLAQEDIAMGAVGSNQMGFYDNLKMLQNQEPSFQDPSGGMAYYNRFPDADGNPTRLGYDSTGGSYGGSLVTGGLSGNLTGLPEVGLLGFGGGIADNVYSGLNFEGAVDTQSKNFAESAAAGGFDPNNYAMFDVNTPTQSQQNAQDAAAIVAQVDQNNRDRQNQAQKDQDAANRAQLTRAAQAAQYQSERNNAAAIANLPNTGPVGASGGSGGGSGSSSPASSSQKILCCAYYELGYLPREIWRLDQRYGVWLHRNNRKLMNGYHAWAAPLADFIKKDTIGGKVARKVMWPIVKAWAEEMAHTMSPEKHKSNKVGKVIATVGEAFSYAVGAVLLPKNNKKEA